MFRAMIKKEFLLLLRDKQTILALFVMPAIFILIMSIAMREQFSAKSIEFTLYAEDLDKSSISEGILSNIQKDEKFKLVDEKEQAEFIVSFAKYYATKREKKVDIFVNRAIKSDQIDIFTSMLSKHIVAAEFDSVAKKLDSDLPLVAKEISSINTSSDNLYEINYNNFHAIPNSTQQSVPAWIVFGMFFIIIPMSTIYVNERKQNTLARLSSMNVSIVSMAISKSIPYLVVNQMQVWIMLGVGMFIVPMFNTPALELNGSIGAIIALSLALSISAIGVSSIIAVSASSSEQATTIGGIFNILLGAIGGVMVPKYIMPESMQKIAELSPMSWGLDGFLDIFLRSANISMIFQDLIKLFIFGTICLIISMIILQIRIKKGF